VVQHFIYGGHYMSITIKRAVAFETNEISLFELYLECQYGKENTKPTFSTLAGLLQRPSQETEWQKNGYYRSKEYLYTVLTGAAKLDQFIVVPAYLVLNSLKEKAKFDAGQTDPEVWKQVIAAIQDDFDNGVTFYIIDGQNRIYNAIIPFFENNIPLGSAPIVGTNSSGEEVFFQGKFFKELDEEMQEYVKNIPITLVIATEGGVNDFTDALIAKNEGLPWEKWMKTLTKNWMMPYRSQLQEISENPQVRETLNRIAGDPYSYEKNGHELLVSELLIWMDAGFQPSRGVDEHQAYFDGRKIVSKQNIKSLIKYIQEFGKGYENIKKKGGLSNVEFRNYIMLRYALDNPKQFIGENVPNWKINLPVEFVNQYRIINKALSQAHSGFIFSNKGNKDVKTKRPLHYPWACSKYTPVDGIDLLKLRLKLLFDEFKKKQKRLIDTHVVSTKISSDPMPSLEAVYHNNSNTVGDFKKRVRAVEVTSKKYDRGHIVSKHNGGSNEIDNLVAQEKRHNRSTQEKDLTV